MFRHGATYADKILKGALPFRRQRWPARSEPTWMLSAPAVGARRSPRSWRSSRPRRRERAENQAGRRKSRGSKVAELTVAKYMHRTSHRPLSGRRGRRDCVVRAEQSNGVSSPLSPPGETPARLRPRSLAWPTTPASACPWSRPVPVPV